MWLKASYFFRQEKHISTFCYEKKESYYIIH